MIAPLLFDTTASKTTELSLVTLFSHSCTSIMINPLFPCNGELLEDISVHSTNSTTPRSIESEKFRDNFET